MAEQFFEDAQLVSLATRMDGSIEVETRLSRVDFETVLSTFPYYCGRVDLDAIVYSSASDGLDLLYQRK